ncbi:unnamed protein product [Paramecium sonneborni]|uniref:Tubby C-terminal domain-containing protein n=1 Tax=Paramecium sonneborni TaxID=65129 RepID=A0A8S1RKN3_9CILI|nr:unnamed protein product [Paramecium sonneborni]
MKKKNKIIKLFDMIHKQSNKCIQEGHESQEILGFCINANCKPSPICFKCIKIYHHDHLEKCIEQSEILKFVNDIIEQLKQSKVQIEKTMGEFFLLFQSVIENMKKVNIKNTIQQKYLKLKNIIKGERKMDEMLKSMEDIVKNLEKNNYSFIYENAELIKQSVNLQNKITNQMKQIYNIVKRMVAIQENKIQCQEDRSQFLNVGKVLVENITEVLINEIYPGTYKELFQKGDKNMLILIGKALVQVKKYKEAIQLFDKTIQINPQFYKAYYQKGFALQKINRYEEAIKSFNQTIQINPYFYKAYNKKGIALSKMERYEEGISCLNQSIEIYPTYFKTYNSKGYVLSQKKKFEEAILCYDQSIRFNSQNDNAKNGKSYALSEMQRIQQENPSPEYSLIQFIDESQQFQDKQQLELEYQKVQMPLGKKHFLIYPPEKRNMIQCTIRRNRRFYPIYEMHLMNEEFLMYAQKRLFNTSSSYIIYESENDMKQSQKFLGKVRSNFDGTQFILYDSGLNPQKTNDREKFRRQLGIVQYKSNLLRGHLKMVVLLPNLNDRDQFYEFKPTNQQDGILKEYQNKNSNQIMTCVNNLPKWNDQRKQNELSFRKRVTQASVKNFQLIEDKKENNILLQFGKVGKDQFNLDFQYPITPLLAFQIVLTVFDYKLLVA